MIIKSVIISLFTNCSVLYVNQEPIILIKPKNTDFAYYEIVLKNIESKDLKNINLKDSIYSISNCEITFVNEQFYKL